MGEVECAKWGHGNLAYRVREALPTSTLKGLHAEGELCAARAPGS
jgi:hypothetical protein